MIAKKLRDDRLIDLVQVKPTSLRPPQEMGCVAEVSAYRAPGVTALDQIPLERVDARPMPGFVGSMRSGFSTDSRVHRGLLTWKHDYSTTAPKLCPVLGSAHRLPPSEIA